MRLPAAGGQGNTIKENGVASAFIADEQSLTKISGVGYRIRWNDLFSEREFQYANPSLKET